jgi:hypothetical protein
MMELFGESGAAFAQKDAAGEQSDGPSKSKRGQLCLNRKTVLKR